MAAISLPFYLTERSSGVNATGLEIDGTFFDPEIHCELCTQMKRVEAEGEVEAAYTINATALTGATKFMLWAAGSDGMTYANTTSVTLGSDWTRYEVDLAGADLTGLTHLLGIEMESGQKFYIKGAAFY